MSARRGLDDARIIFGNSLITVEIKSFVIRDSLGQSAALTLNLLVSFLNFSPATSIFGAAQVIDLTRLLPKLLRANGGNVELAVKLAWARAAGSGLRRQTIANRLDGQALVVFVPDVLWQRQLNQMSRELIFRINTLLGQKVIESIMFEISAANFPAAPDKRPASEAQTAKTAVPTDLLFAAGTISDEDLRARFLRAAENCIQRREALSENEP
jgi:hypothetical protein